MSMFINRCLHLQRLMTNTPKHLKEHGNLEKALDVIHSLAVKINTIEVSII